MKNPEKTKNYLIILLATLLSVVIAAVAGTFVQQLLFGNSNVAVTVSFALLAAFGISRTIWQATEKKASMENE